MSSDQIKPTIRPDKLLDMRDYIMQAIGSYEVELVRTCLTCQHFRETQWPNNSIPAETCIKFKARPPARVIAYGCNDYFNEAEIPF